MQENIEALKFVAEGDMQRRGLPFTEEVLPPKARIWGHLKFLKKMKNVVNLACEN